MILQRALASHRVQQWSSLRRQCRCCCCCCCPPTTHTFSGFACVLQVAVWATLPNTLCTPSLTSPVCTLLLQWLTAFLCCLMEREREGHDLSRVGEQGLLQPMKHCHHHHHHPKQHWRAALVISERSVASSNDQSAKNSSQSQQIEFVCLLRQVQWKGRGKKERGKENKNAKSRQLVKFTNATGQFIA